jgi:glycosyltransferase involved in cell wall biosynthesis
MHPDKTMVVDISSLNGNKVFLDRYPGAQVVTGFPNAGDIREFLEGLDVVFLAEAAYNFNLYTIAKEMGVRVANQYNYEFFDWVDHPELPMPDMFIAPSMWHYDVIQRLCERFKVKHSYLHCPVDRDDLPYNPSLKFDTFLHVAGRSAAHDRNGTETVIKASKFLKTPAKILIHFQGEQGLAHQATHPTDHYQQLAASEGDLNKLTIECVDYPDYRTVYEKSDVMILPRRYGGNCLPVNEALSKGMPVLMPDISPNNSLLHPNWLLPAHLVGQFAPRTIVDIYECYPEELAAKIDEMWLMGIDEVNDNTRIADFKAEAISWNTLEPAYRKVLEDLCTPS